MNTLSHFDGRSKLEQTIERWWNRRRADQLRPAQRLPIEVRGGALTAAQVNAAMRQWKWPVVGGAVFSHGRCHPWLGRIKILWGRLTDDPWLELEGRQLRHRSIRNEWRYFAQTRPVSPTPRGRISS